VNFSTRKDYHEPLLKSGYFKKKSYGGQMATKILPSACPMDCPDTCSLEIEVTDNKVTHICGSHGNPTTQEFTCTKVARFTRRGYSKDRLLYPMKRVGEKGQGEFERISWQEALKII
jgi:anaerobic selenocysteine-containing dehydrogenase